MGVDEMIWGEMMHTREGREMSLDWRVQIANTLPWFLFCFFDLFLGGV